MRIVHVSDGYLPRLGGIERHVHDLATRQAADGHDVGVVTTVSGHTARAKDVQVIRPGRASTGSGTALRPCWAPRAARHPVIGTADVVHVHSSSVSPLAYLAIAEARRRQVPTLVTMHSLLAAAAPVFRLGNAALGLHSDRIVWSAVSQAAARPLRRALGPEQPVTVLANAVDAAEWRVPAAPTDPDRLVVASVGRLAARKRPRQLLHILRRARAALPARIRMEAIIIGDGPLRMALDTYVRGHRMDDWVTLMGSATHDEIRRAYRDTDLYIAPATLESFGIAALEARCAGLPVLARAQGGVTEFITDGVDGVLAKDDAGLAEAIVRLGRAPQLRAALRRRIQQSRPPFDWPQALTHTYALYEQAITGAGRAIDALAPR